MPAIDAVECPHCAARIRIKSESILGKKVNCPKCAEPFVAKAPTNGVAKAEKTAAKSSGRSATTSPSDAVVVACPHCEAKFRMNSTSLGKKRTCPKCAEEFTPRTAKATPGKTTTAKPAKVQEDADDDEDFLKSLSAAAKDSRSADAEEEPESDDAEELAPRRSKSKSSTGKKKKKSRSSSGGGFIMPGIVGWIIGGTIGGTVGAGIWVAVGYFSGYEVGWIAWGVGFLTGLGVGVAASANGEADGASGITAAVISILAVLGGKYAVVHLLIDKIMGQVQAADPAVQQAGQALKQAVFLNSFGPLDLLWFFLAAGTAFKVGSGQQEGD